MGPRHWNILYNSFIIGIGFSLFSKNLVNYLTYGGQRHNFPINTEIPSLSQLIAQFVYLTVPWCGIFAVMQKNRTLLIVPLTFTTIFAFWHLGLSGYNFFNRLDLVRQYAWHRKVVVAPFVLNILHCILWSFVCRKQFTLIEMWKLGYSGDETDADLTQICPIDNVENDDDKEEDDDDIEANDDNKGKKNITDEGSIGLTQGTNTQHYAVYKKHGWSLETNYNKKRSSSPPLPRTLQSMKDNNIRRSSRNSITSLNNKKLDINNLTTLKTFPSSGSLLPSTNPSIILSNNGILKPESKNKNEESKEIIETREDKEINDSETKKTTDI
jgi:hypothetical protein